MHPETLRGLSQAQQFHVYEINQDQYVSLSGTLSLTVTGAEKGAPVERSVRLLD
jgi:hypothetical protein